VARIVIADSAAVVLRAGILPCRRIHRTASKNPADKRVLHFATSGIDIVQKNQRKPLHPGRVAIV
jgi:hypothetical protein